MPLALSQLWQPKVSPDIATCLPMGHGCPCWKPVEQSYSYRKGMITGGRKKRKNKSLEFNLTWPQETGESAEIQRKIFHYKFYRPDCNLNGKSEWELRFFLFCLPFPAQSLHPPVNGEQNLGETTTGLRHHTAEEVFIFLILCVKGYAKGNALGHFHQIIKET